jgi:hypothetical protein
MSKAVRGRTVPVMFHDPTSRRLIADARREELQRYAKPLASRDQDDEHARPSRALSRLRRLFPR